MEAVEDAGAQFKQRFWRPVQRMSALVQGIKFGLDLLRSRKATKPSGEEPSAEQEEELFIWRIPKLRIEMTAGRDAGRAFFCW